MKLLFVLQKMQNYIRLIYYYNFNLLYEAIVCATLDLGIDQLNILLFQSSLWSYFLCYVNIAFFIIMLFESFQSSLWSYFLCYSDNSHFEYNRSYNFNLLYEATFCATKLTPCPLASANRFQSSLWSTFCATRYLYWYLSEWGLISIFFMKLILLLLCRMERYYSWIIILSIFFMKLLFVLLNMWGYTLLCPCNISIFFMKLLFVLQIMNDFERDLRKIISIFFMKLLFVLPKSEFFRFR